MALSENIKAKRMERGMTQSEVAERIGVSPVAICQFETNRSKPQPETLIALAKCLGTTAEELVLGKEE